MYLKTLISYIKIIIIKNKFRLFCFQDFGDEYFKMIFFIKSSI